jgi:hypothetical protein
VGGGDVADADDVRGLPGRSVELVTGLEVAGDGPGVAAPACAAGMPMRRASGRQSAQLEYLDF